MFFIWKIGKIIWIFNLARLFVLHNTDYPYETLSIFFSRAYPIAHLFSYFRAFSNIFLNILKSLFGVYIIIPINVDQNNFVLSSTTQALNRFGDRFAFFNIVSVCCLNKHLQRWKDLWTIFNQVIIVVTLQSHLD